MLGIWAIVVITAIDNALLAGVLMGKVPPRQKQTVIVCMGILLAIAQVVCSVSVDHFMKHLIFQVASIVLLSWMSVRVLCMDFTRLSGQLLGTVARLFLYTFIGNLDNIIWLGSTLKGDRVWLILSSSISVPIFIIVAKFLSHQIERQTWIIPLGAGMMAWAAASLTLSLPAVKTFINTLDDAPNTTIQCLITIIILVIGFGTRQLLNRVRR